MNEYRSRGKELLKIFINNGYEAYFIGEAVRNMILEKNIKLIEITTSAHIEVVKKIFNDCIITYIDENSVNLKYAGYNFIIKSFSGSSSKKNSSLFGKHYSSNLLDDLSSRDFSVNAIAMSLSGKLTDAYDGYNDIKKKLISHIGNAKDRFYKDPSIIIKAFVLMSELNYKFVPKTKKAVTRRKKFLTHCDINTLLPDLKKVFEGVYAKKTIKAMHKLKISKSIPLFKKVLYRLNVNYNKQTFEEVLLMADILNGKLNDSFKPYINDYEQYCKVYDLSQMNKNSKFDLFTLYSYGLKNCLLSNKINYYLGNTRLKERKIKKKWDKLPIKNTEEINYRIEDLQKIIKEKDYKKIDFVLEEVVKLILSNELKNTRSDVEKGIIQVLQKNSIIYNLQGFSKQEVNDVIDSIPVNEDNDKKTKKIDDAITEVTNYLINNKYIDTDNVDVSNLERDMYNVLSKYMKEDG